jgi:nucleotide-binding universal stress UspA family protein
MANLTALIPLDTTDFSESSLLLLPMLKELGFDRVRLISALDPKKKDLNMDLLASYLDGKKSKVTALGLEAETRVSEGDAAEVILAAADATDVDLIVIATHGRTGIARLRFGSVGDKLIKDASCPRLVIGPNVSVDLEHYNLHRILVPLDGSELSEMSLPVAKYIAGETNASVDLLRSVSPATAVSDPSMGAVDLLTPMLDEAANYLASTETKLAPVAVTSQVITGRADDAILDHLAKNQVDLVIMASSGRTGLVRAALGSTAERVLQGPDPVMIFEPGEDRSRLFQAARAAYAN